MHEQFQQPIDYKQLIETQAKEPSFPVDKGKSSFVKSKPEGSKSKVKALGSKKRG